MFRPGDKIHTHDGKTHTFRGRLPKHGLSERPAVRGFVRVGLVDPDGTEHLTDWSENLVTVFGFQTIVRNFAGIISSVSSVASTISATADMAWPRWMAIGSAATSSGATTAIASTDSCVSIAVGMTGSEYGTASTGTGGGRVNMTISPNQQSLTGTWALVQTLSWASNSLYSGSAGSVGAVLNAVAMHYHSSSGSAISIAGFQQVTKLSNQALNLTYSWNFST